MTTKSCRIPEDSKGLIDQRINKITRSLPHIENDLVVFNLLLRKNTDKYHPRRSRPLRRKDYSDSKPELARFEGLITFRLSRRQLYVHFKGRTIDECLESGFNRILQRIKKYKDLHFSEESQYPDHLSIRGY